MPYVVTFGVPRFLKRLPTDLLLITFVYFVLAIAYSVATPILEVSDESTHVATTWAIASGRGLPVMNPSDPRRVLVPAQEAGQPPLSHLLDAAITFWIRAPDPVHSLLVNPQANVGSPDREPWNKNLFVHTNAEAFPWHGLALSVHVQRLLSVIWGAVAVVAVYALAGLAGSSSPELPLLATSLVAFNPMFLFMAGSADNDTLAAALCAVTLLVLCRALRHGGSQRLVLLIGTLTGLALLTKLNAGAIALPAALVVVWLAWQQRSWRLAWQYPLLMAAPAVALSGWWFLRNWRLYHDPLALNVFVQMSDRRRSAPSSGEWLTELSGIWQSYWGVLGNFNMLLPAPWYSFINLLAIGAGIGFVVRVRRHLARADRLDGVLVLLVGWLVLEVLLLVRFTEVVVASTGRLLLGAAASIAVLLALGLLELAGRLRRIVAGTVVAIYCVGAILVLPLCVMPAYASPDFVSPGALHPRHRLSYRYGNLELLGATLPSQAAAPGSTVHVTLYWQSLGVQSVEDVVSLQLLGPDGTLVSQADSLPDGGRALMAAWPVGMALADTIPLRIPETGPSPAVSHLAVFVYPIGQPNRRVPATGTTGNVVATPEIGVLDVRGVNPYTLLAVHRPDVLRFYAANGWNPQTQGRQIFDNWLAHGPDGGPSTTAAAYVKARGWLATAAP